MSFTGKRVYTYIKYIGCGLTIMLISAGVMSCADGTLFSHKQTVKISKVTTPTPTPPSFSEWDDYPSTEEVKGIQSEQPEDYQQQTPLIDCIGPDRKHFQTSQQECENFNKAWGKTSQATNQAQKPLSKQDVKNVIIDLENQRALAEFQSQKRDDEAKKCFDDALSNVNSCENPCYGNRQYGNNACFSSYSGAYPLIENNKQKLDECNAEVDSIYNSCISVCADAYTKALDACGTH